MTSPLLHLLTDRTSLSLIAIAACTAAYSSYRANDILLKQRTSGVRSSTPSVSDQFMDENTRVLEGSTAIAFPIIATISILFLFFFIHSLGVVLTLLSAISSFFAVLFLLWPFGETIGRQIRSLGIPLRTDGWGEALIVLPFASAVILAWLFTGNWITNNIIGVSMCVFLASLCKVSNLKVTTMLFAGLFVYDIFFVFFSEKFFGRNVMLEVATSAPTNPVSSLVKFFNLPFTPVQNLALPAKLIIPADEKHYAILGLGDIILPVILLVFLLEVDIVKTSREGSLLTGYFVAGMIAYVFALFISFFFNFAFRNAQPALLYIVPVMLVTSLLLARKRREVSLLWSGMIRRSSQMENAEHQNLNPTVTNATGSSSAKDPESTALVT